MGNLLDLMAPGGCILCGDPGHDGLCPVCRKNLDALFDPRSFRCSGGNGYADGMFALFHYDIKLPKNLILDLKANGYRDSVDLFGDYMKKAVAHPDFPADCDLVTYCPRSLSARGARGFDQSKYLAQAASRAMGLPSERLLSRAGFVRTQHKLRAQRRWENVRDSFIGERNLAGENILLVDDVVTTGATANEAAKTLKNRGAMRVFVLCLAH